MAVKKYTKSNSQRKNYNFVDPLNPPEQRIDATGGTISYAGPYKIHTFTANGTFTVTQGSYQEIDYLIIAGGGPAGRGNGSGASGGAAGGALMNWVGLANTFYAQCIGPELYTQSGDVWTVNVGAGGVALDNNSINGCGGDSWLLKNGFEILRTYGGGGGGGGTAAFVGYNGGCGAGSPGTGGNGTNQWPTTLPSALVNEYQYQFNHGKTTSPYKQGNGNCVPGVTAANQRQGASAGAWTPSIYYWSVVGTDTTVRGSSGINAYPGYGFKTSFGGTYQTYGNAGYCGTQYTVAGTPAAPTTPGSGGHSMITTGLSGNGSAGQVIFRYLTNKTIAAANVEMLIVGGGGGSGSISSGPGGGGGSVIYYGNESANTGGPVKLYNGTYTIVVGAGGVLSTSQTVSSRGGQSSVIGVPNDTVTHYGIAAANTFGGFDAYGGGSKYRALEELHGSGHGVYGGQNVYQYGYPAPGHGFRGGAGFGGAPTCHGGGGGAGAVGGDAVNLTNGGAGGIGKQYSISGTATYYGGGGGGARSTTGGTIAAGGLGGGAAGLNGTNTVANSGTVNTGGGGGGAQGGTSGGAGGSGIVIIRYPDSYPAANGTTGSPTVVVSGGWRTYTFTQSGTISFG
jgi:hypothetical protein